MRDRGRRRAESRITVHSSADRWVVSDRRSPPNESPREAAFVLTPCSATDRGKRGLGTRIRVMGKDSLLSKGAGRLGTHKETD